MFHVGGLGFSPIFLRGLIYIYTHMYVYMYIYIHICIYPFLMALDLFAPLEWFVFFPLVGRYRKPGLPLALDPFPYWLSRLGPVTDSLAFHGLGVRRVEAGPLFGGRREPNGTPVCAFLLFLFFLGGGKGRLKQNTLFYGL